MRFIRRWPFLTLALVTLIVGAVWHVVSDGSRSGIAYSAVSVLGAPFIAAMRWARQLVGSSRITPLVGLLIGLAPYVIAEVLLRVVRSRRRAGPS